MSHQSCGERGTCELTLPSIFCWAGIQENPWVISDEKIADALTKICDVHFGDLAENPITPNSEPVRIVSVQHSLHAIFSYYSIRYPSDLASGAAASGPLPLPL